MDPRIRIIGVLTILVIGSGLMVQGSVSAEEATAPVQSIAKTGKVKLQNFLAGGPSCETFEPVGKDKKQTVSIYIDTNTKPSSIEFKSPKCVQESAKGSLTFTVANLPTGYQLEIDFQTRYDDDLKPHKGPFKFRVKKPTAKYPVAGRCMMSKTPDDSCIFDEHDSSIPNETKFRFTVFLWDPYGNLADEKDPGVMVVDNP